MSQIIFDLETITPMFMSGQDQAVFELRPPSLKGMLRFWWRAYYWGQNIGDVTSKELQACMEKKEGRIFGTSSDNGRKSALTIRLKQPDTQGVLAPFPKRTIKVSSGGRTFPINILEYLAYGTYEYQRGSGNVFNRKYLPAGAAFTVTLNTRETDTEKDSLFEKGETFEENVFISLYLLSAFGALGAKSRNGFGNLTVTNIKLENSDLVDRLPFNELFPFPTKAFLSQKIKNPNLPSFSAFSKGMKIFKLKNSYRSWDQCLAELGIIYRSCKGSMDHGMSCEKRQYIASPITIQKIVGGRPKIYDTSFLERRSKPYFIKVVKRRDAFEGYILWLPSAYCEGLKTDRNNNPVPHNADEKFRECCDAFNEYLGERMEIFYGDQKRSL